MAQIQEESIGCEGDWTATRGTSCGGCCVAHSNHWFATPEARVLALRQLGFHADRTTAADAIVDMIASQTDLDIILGLLSDHYGIDVLVLPENVDRLAVVTLANAVHDDPNRSVWLDKSRKLARIVLDLMADHRAPEAT